LVRGVFLSRRLSVFSAGDVDGDGFSDIIVGDPYFSDGQTDEGRAEVYRGSPSGLQETPGWSKTGQLNSNFGEIVGNAGDVNGDGYDDVFVAADAYENPVGDNGEGAVFVYHGTTTGAMFFTAQAQD
jgi:hypothetical protein